MFISSCHTNLVESMLSVFVSLQLLNLPFFSLHILNRSSGHSTSDNVSLLI